MAKKAAAKKAAATRKAKRQAIAQEAEQAAPSTQTTATQRSAGAHDPRTPEPARQIPGQIIGQVDPEAGPVPGPIDPKTAIRVEATALCYYDHQLRRVGDVFDIRNEKEMSKAMRAVPKSTPTRFTTPNEALAREKAQDTPNLTLPEPAGSRASDGDVLG